MKDYLQRPARSTALVSQKGWKLGYFAGVMGVVVVWKMLKRWHDVRHLLMLHALPPSSQKQNVVAGIELDWF